jgi:hypothetical protein
MGTLILKFLPLAIFLSVCACSTRGQAYDPNAQSPGPVAGPPLIPGSELGPLPSGAPANSVATTTGGYATLQSIHQNPVDSSESLIGAAVMGSRAIILFERSPSSGMYFWDVYEMSQAGAFKLDCSIPRPLGSNGTFNGVTYNGSKLVVLNLYYRTGFSAYSLDLDTCTTASVGTLYSTSQYFTQASIPFSYYGGAYIFAVNSLVTANPQSGIITPWNYVTASLSGEIAQPNTQNFMVTSQGTSWFVSNSRYHLWCGDGLGKWTGWTELPYTTYQDLTQVQSILSFGAGDLRLLTFNPSAVNKVLKVYQLEVSHF